MYGKKVRTWESRQGLDGKEDVREGKEI